MDAASVVAASSDMMHQVLKMAATESTQMAKKIVDVSNEMKVDHVSREAGIGAAIDLVA